MEYIGDNIKSEEMLRLIELDIETYEMIVRGAVEIEEYELAATFAGYIIELKDELKELTKGAN